jgi:hypothetical protein
LFQFYEDDFGGFCVALMSGAAGIPERIKYAERKTKGEYENGTSVLIITLSRKTQFEIRKIVSGFYCMVIFDST